MPPRVRDRFDEWLEVPLSGLPEDPRFEVRRATPAEFERIYDLVDVVFGERRPRALYDWLYRRNPLGPARCWIVCERDGGRLVGTGARFPWPVARGSEAVQGMLVGDVGMAPEWQRRGVGELRRLARLRHPMTAEEAAFGWANDNSVARSLHKGRSSELIGPLDEGVLRLRRSWVAGLLSGFGRTTADVPRIEDVDHFDASFDAVSVDQMAWGRYWCPHSADFLNWRYSDHPTRTYRSLAAYSGDIFTGYAVLRAEGRTALLMELVAPEGSAAARALVTAAVDEAREADCRRIVFHAPSRFRHWPLLRKLGFVERPGQRYIFTEMQSVPGVPDSDPMMLVPGDSDAE